MSEKTVTVKKRLKDGSIKTYKYNRKLETPEIVSGTLGHLIQEYKQSREFSLLSPATQDIYARSWAFLEPSFPDLMCEMRRKHVMTIRDHVARRGAGTANMVVAALGVLCRYALDRESYGMEFNPCAGIKRFPQNEGEPWPKEAVSYWIQNAREHMRRPVILGLALAQRRGDILSMTWNQYDGQAIDLTQSKTGVRLTLPVTAALKKELDTWKSTATAVTILTNWAGQPWTPDQFNHAFVRERDNLGLSGIVFHGLRHTKLTELADGGHSVHDLSAVSGHLTLTHLQRYTKKADQKRGAERAFGVVKKFAPRSGKLKNK